MDINMDYYKVLGISPNADDKEIKKAYRERARKYHPDSYNGLNQEQVKAAETEFEKIQDAYTILSNPKKRKKYDSSRLAMKKKVTPTHNRTEKKPNNQSNIFERYGNGGSLFGTYEGLNYSGLDYSGLDYSGLDTYKKDIKEQSNSTGRKKEEKEENFDEIEDIAKKIQETREYLSILEKRWSRLLDEDPVYVHQKQISEYEQELKGEPMFKEATDFILKIQNKDRNVLTRLLISTKQIEKLKQYKKYIEDTDKKIQDKKDKLEEASKEYKEKKENLSELRHLTREKLSLLEKQYKNHPSYTKYELHKMTHEEKKDSKSTNKNNSNKNH